MSSNKHSGVGDGDFSFASQGLRWRMLEKVKIPHLHVCQQTNHRTKFYFIFTLKLYKITLSTLP